MSNGKDVMSAERWQRIKQLQPKATMLFQSCLPKKHKGTRATYRKAEHGAKT